MATASRQAQVTFDEFCLRIEDGQKADLIEGVIYMASPESLVHNDIMAFLLGLLTAYLQKKNLGRVFASRVALRLARTNAPEPDILVVGTDKLDRLRIGHVAGSCDVVVEIVSPDSVERDYQTKRQLYERYRIAEYWIIDPLEEVVLLLRLGPNGKYKECAAKNGVYRSKAIPGFWFEGEWFWQRPLPDLLDTAAKLLADS